MLGIPAPGGDFGESLHIYACSLGLRQSAIKGIMKINLIQTQDLVELVRYFIGSIFTMFKNRHVGRENVLEFGIYAMAPCVSPFKKN